MPESIAFDMTEILNAIKKGQPDNPATVVAEIKEIISGATFPAEKKQAAEDYIKQNETNVINLTQLLNRVRTFSEAA